VRCPQVLGVFERGGARCSDVGRDGGGDRLPVAPQVHDLAALGGVDSLSGPGHAEGSFAIGNRFSTSTTAPSGG
jgi:hypothetical protein